MIYLYTYLTSLFLRCKPSEWREEKKRIKLKIAIVFVYATLIYCTFVCTDSIIFKGEFTYLEATYIYMSFPTELKAIATLLFYIILEN